MSCATSWSYSSSSSSTKGILSWFPGALPRMVRERSDAIFRGLRYSAVMGLRVWVRNPETRFG